jgi:predicted TIM-barrel fold metal-dependent hydrolase
MDLSLFDAHCYVGRFKGYREGFFHTREALREEMDRFGIAEALVCDTLSRELDPHSGNRRVLETCADEPRLHPAWAWAPPAQSLPWRPEELPARLSEAGVRAVWLFPGQLHFTLREWNLHPLLEALEAQRVPLFLDGSPTLADSPRDVTDWDGVVSLCRDHPDLPVIATEFRMYWLSRQWYAALEAAPNLRLELSPFWAYQGLELICREFGSHRVLFGTRLPVREAGGTVAQLQYAEIDDAAKRDIAGDNLRRLLAGALPGSAERPPAPPRAAPAAAERGSLYHAIREAAEPFEGERLVDIHSHLGPGSPYFLPDSTPAEVMAQVRRHGFEKIVGFAFAGLNADWRWGNDVAHAAMREHPDLLLPLAAVHLWDLGEMEEEMRRCCDERGFWGVKLHPWWNGYPETGPNVRAACAFCHERGLILTNHYWGPPEMLDACARDFPNARLITGHLVSEDAYVEVANRHANVFVCTCLPVQRPDLTAAVRKLDPGKLLFGSDIPDLPLPSGFGPILYADLPDETKRRILGLNALELLAGVAPNVRRREP